MASVIALTAGFVRTLPVAPVMVVMTPSPSIIIGSWCIHLPGRVGVLIGIGTAAIPVAIAVVVRAAALAVIIVVVGRRDRRSGKPQSQADSHSRPPAAAPTAVPAAMIPAHAGHVAGRCSLQARSIRRHRRRGCLGRRTTHEHAGQISGEGMFVVQRVSTGEQVILLLRVRARNAFGSVRSIRRFWPGLSQIFREVIPSAP
jgi:hypothetical protein